MAMRMQASACSSKDTYATHGINGHRLKQMLTGW
jgi:hypothetical protein